MDIATVTITTALEIFFIRNWRVPATEKLSTQHVVILFLVQYFLLKYYRMFLYPTYFSPLRHFPGPGVRRRCSTHDWRLVTD